MGDEGGLNCVGVPAKGAYMMEWFTVGGALWGLEEPAVWVGDEGELNCVGVPAKGAYMMEWLTVGGALGVSEEPVV